MANNSTITLQEIVDWGRTQVKMIPIVGVGGFSQEPAITICNQVISEMLQGGIGPDGRAAGPFPWKFNRVVASSFLTVVNQQDYSANITDLSWIESCDIAEDGSGLRPRAEMQAVRMVPLVSIIGTPTKICWLPNNDTSIYWRVWPSPDLVWRIHPVYQKKPPLKIKLNETWSPIPDDLAYVFRQGFLAMAKRHVGSTAWGSEYQLFQAMIQKALGTGDTEDSSFGFYPERSIMLG